MKNPPFLYYNPKKALAGEKLNAIVRKKGEFMNKAYENMRAFWLDAKNFDNRKGIIEIGPEKIVAAGVEMALADGETIKHLLIATNSLGDSSLYFENNSKSGLGGMIGGHGNEPLQEAAAHMLAYGGKLTAQMVKIPATQPMPTSLRAGQVYLFAVSKQYIFYKELPEQELRNPDNPFYPMFAYSQQVIGLFKAQETQQPPSARA